MRIARVYSKYDIMTPETFDKLKQKGLLELFNNPRPSEFCEPGVIYTSRKLSYLKQDIKTWLTRLPQIN